MKRLFAICMVLCLAITMLAGCGQAASNTSASTSSAQVSTPATTASSASSDNAVTLQMWTFWNDPQATDFTTCANKYGPANNQNVKVQYTSIPYNDYVGTKLISAFAAGQGPDIFVTCAPEIARYVDAGVAMPLNNYFTDSMKQDFGTSLNATTFNGNIDAIPMAQDLLGLYYDKDAFDAAGLQPPTTWDELKADAKKLTTSTRAGLTIRVANDTTCIFNWLPFLWETGSDVFTPDFKASGLTTQGAADSLQLYHDLMASGSLNAKPSRNADDIGIMADGETAMQITGTWVINDLEKKYSTKHIDVVPIPVPKAGDKSMTAAGGWQIMVNSQSKNADIAAKLVTWVWGQDQTQMKNFGTVDQFSYPPRQSLIAQSDIYQQGLRKYFTDNIYGHSKPELRAPAQIQQIIQDMIQQALYQTDGATAAKDANDKINQFLATYKGAI